MSEQEIKMKLRAIPLQERLGRCAAMIGKMCSEGRAPKMSIPVRWEDEDYFIAETVREAAKEIDKINRHIITCVYCGMEYPEGTPTWGAAVLTKHIKVCDKHPMREAEATISRLRKALIGLVGEEDPQILQAMQDFLAISPIPDAEKQVTINAINTLIETMSYAKGKN